MPDLVGCVCIAAALNGAVIDDKCVNFVANLKGDA